MKVVAEVDNNRRVSIQPPRGLQGDDLCDAAIAAIGGVVDVRPVPMSSAQHATIEKLRRWLTGGSTIIVEGAHGSGRHEGVAVAVLPRRTVVANFAEVAPRHAEATLVALRREAMLCDAVPVLANLDDLWSRIPPSDELQLALAAAIDHVNGPLVITTSMPGLELRPKARTILRLRWPLPDAKTRRALWQLALGDEAADLDLVAHRYELGSGGIEAAVRSARHHAELRHESPQLPDLLLGVERLDRIELRGAHGGVEARGHTDEHGHAER